MELGYLVESASLQQLYQRLSRQQIFISMLGKLDALKTQLDNHPLVEDWEILGQERVSVYFSGTQEDCALLLRSLILSWNFP
jgi:ABC-2 type transport system ATP-binding protein